MLGTGEGHMGQMAMCIKVQGREGVIVQGQNTKVEVILRPGVMLVLEIGTLILIDMLGHMTDMIVGQGQVTEVPLFLPDEIGKIGTTIVIMIMKLVTRMIIITVNIETEIGMLIRKNTVMMKDIAIKVTGQKVTGQGRGQMVKGQGRGAQAEGEDSTKLKHLNIIEPHCKKTCLQGF